MIANGVLRQLDEALFYHWRISNIMQVGGDTVSTFNLVKSLAYPMSLIDDTLSTIPQRANKMSRLICGPFDD
ncbi:hypothetical protein KSX_32120 [Ktedonospora formicarum]|uniref:Uncharacterized protein n=1 Tax=Ktedonospora formicarum TaxID=2778364 RepID=A0A8J3I429_9CHLR|nr:hypothetical protein KSX_32120 [Ktedonospora formicarum]